MMAFVRRWTIEAEDRLRYSPHVRNLIGRYKCWREPRGIPYEHQAIVRAIRDLCSIARLLQDPTRIRRVEERIRDHVTRLDAARVNWAEFVPSVDNPWIARGVVLKPYIGPREPGIVYIGFEVEWLRLLRHAPLRPFADRYTLIVAPSSNPYNLINCIFPAVYPTPLYSLVNHDEDVEILHRIAPNYRVVPMYTSHWVNPTIYQPRPRNERDIDILMVAAWGKVKRHHLLFGALRRMPASLRVVLIGQDQDGRTQETMRREAGLYGVADRFEMWSNLSHPQVRDAFCRAKFSILLSLREGSAVVVPESLFADTPVGLMYNADNGSRGFINEQTGRLLRERDLAGQLMDFLANADRCTPRAWAEANISCFKSTARLNEILRTDALAVGHDWTRDIYPLCWQPDPRLVNPADWYALRGERADIHARFGVTLGPEELPA
jgi:glycosyltransferase involved in cell wall biosynthesis